jgi:hypothetical protein
MSFGGCVILLREIKPGQEKEMRCTETGCVVLIKKRTDEARTQRLEKSAEA